MSLSVATPRVDARVLIPPAVVASTLGLALLAGLGRLPLPPVEIPIAFGTLVALGFILTRIELGTALLPLVAAAVPFAIGTGTQTSVVAALILGGLLMGMWLVRSIISHRIRLIKSPIYFPAVALMLVWTVSYVYSNAVRPPLIQAWPSFALAQVGGLAVVLISVGVLLLALNAGEDLRRIQLAVWGVMGVGIAAIVEYFAHLPINLGFLNTNGLFTMWTVALMYSQALFNERLPRWARVGLGLAAAGWVFKSAVRETIWFSGWAPTIVVVVVITLLWSWRVCAALLPFVTVAIALNFNSVYQLVWNLAVGKGDLSRLDIWQEQFNLIRQYPLLGTGPAGYAVFNVNLFADSIYAMSTHSNYLDVLAETGIVGSVIFAWFMLTLLYLGFRAAIRWRTGFDGGFANGTFAGLLGVLFAMGLGDWFIPFVYNQTISGFRYTVHSWVFFGFLAFLAAKPPIEKEA